MVASILVIVFGLFCLQSYGYRIPQSRLQSCDTIERGFQCSDSISHYWGQYSPYFSVPSNVSSTLPETCQINFVQVLSRHGARDPTASKTAQYSALIARIHSAVPAASLRGGYAFLANYTYTLGADQLTRFGQQEMINSGIKFFDHYSQLTANSTPFIRASSESRVVESAQNFSQGFHSARLASKAPSDPTHPFPIVVISEDDGSNNTLNHGLCTAFESGPDSDIGSNAQATWSSIFIPPIQARLNANLPGANFSAQDTISMMDLCPFNTVASPTGTLSPFCALFTDDEWKSYDYYETLGKYYGYSHGNPLGPTQGVGWVEELLARLTSNHSYVRDGLYTSVNHTLDDNTSTFPLGDEVKVYADFSHDNDITSALAALGLYNVSSTNGMLSDVTREDPESIGGYSAAWTVPFAARVYVERMACAGEREHLVRVLVNDRIVPLIGCDVDTLGRCRLSEFVDGLAFARSGGEWKSCFD